MEIRFGDSTSPVRLTLPLSAIRLMSVRVGSTGSSGSCGNTWRVLPTEISLAAMEIVPFAVLIGAVETNAESAPDIFSVRISRSPNVLRAAVQVMIPSEAIEMVRVEAATASMVIASSSRIDRS